MLPEDFDPNGCSLANGNFIGLPFDEDSARIVFLPVPWEVTVSYSAGTARAAENILRASYQLDLYDADVIDAWQVGIFMRPMNRKLLRLSDKTRYLACQHIERVERREKPKQKQLAKINERCARVHDWVEEQAAALLQEGKMPVVVGGDHSTPLGLIRAVGKHYAEQKFGILHIDAHADLRPAYEDFTYSHASIFYNVLREVPNVSQLTQVGIRDYCEQELDVATADGRVKMFFDQDIKEAQYRGETYHKICEQIIATLPDLVYVSVDIDGLDPKLCPNTGTPVAGGFELQQVFYLFKLLVQSGRTIIGFDLVEVGAASEWDGNVAARLLYRLANFAARSQGWI